MEWGDPEANQRLGFIRDHFVLPYVNSEHVALEIGPGGGRWTRYLLGFGQLYVVDYHAELLRELKRNFNQANVRFIKNSGADFPGVSDGSIDFLFSFDCFVHLDMHLIETYLKNIGRILRPGGNALIHYSDKSKVKAQMNPDFSENTPERMRRMILQSGFLILEEDVITTQHSSIVRFTH